MSTDVKIDCSEGKFKFRVSGVVQIGNKYLTVKIGNNNFFCLPGGHVELGEDTDHAVLREMREELNYDVKIVKLIAIIQNFFMGGNSVPFHELGYFYIVKPKNKNIKAVDSVRMENDKGKIVRLEFKWLSLEELKKVDFRPKVLIDLFEKQEFCHIINKDENFIKSTQKTKL